MLGAGGVGGLLAAALAHAGGDVVLIMRPESLDRYDGRIAVESVALGDFEVAVPAAAALARPVDVVWVATKAADLEGALALAPPAIVGGAAVIPLLNGIDHVPALRERYANVVAGVIRVEADRPAVGRIRQLSPFVRVELAGTEPVTAELVAAGLECRSRADELTMLWEKLVFLGPLALATTASGGPFGAVRRDARYLRCAGEYLDAAAAEGAAIDREALRALQDEAPDALRSSMQKDVAAGRPPELDAIAGPVLRAGLRRGVETPATRELADTVAELSRGGRAAGSR